MLAPPDSLTQRQATPPSVRAVAPGVPGSGVHPSSAAKFGLKSNIAWAEISSAQSISRGIVAEESGVGATPGVAATVAVGVGATDAVVPGNGAGAVAQPERARTHPTAIVNPPRRRETRISTRPLCGAQPVPVDTTPGR